MYKSVKFQASGVRIDPQCKKDYDDMHQRKMYSYLIFRISDDDTTIIVEKKGQKGSPYSEFVEVRFFSLKFLNCRLPGESENADI